MKTKRIISILLSVLLMLNSVPLTAFADDAVSQNDYIYSELDEYCIISTEEPSNIPDMDMQCNITEYYNTDVFWSYDAETKTLYLDSTIVNGSIYKDGMRLPTRMVYFHELKQEVYDEEYQMMIEEGFTEEEIEDYFNQALEIVTDVNGVEHKGVYEEFYWDGYNYVEKLIIGNKVGDIGDINLGLLTNLKHIDFEEESHLGAFNAKFYGTQIQSVNFPCSLTTLGNYAFQNTPVEEVSFKNTQVSAIPDYCFQNTPNLNKVLMNNKISVIGPYAFQNSGIEALDMRWVIRIGDFAFAASKIKSMDLWGTVISTIPRYCFSGSALESIRLPSTLTQIRDYAFNNTKLTDIDIPTSIESIGQHAFSNCQNIDSIKISTTVGGDSHSLSIGQYAFADSGIKNIDLYDANVETIFGYTFQRNNFDTFIMPKNCNLIYGYAFYGTTINHFQITSCTRIYSNAFRNATIKDFVIPSNCTKIENNAFYAADIEYMRVESDNINIYDEGFNAFNNLPLKTFVYLNNKDYGYEGGYGYLGEKTFLNSGNISVYGYTNTPLHNYCMHQNIPFTAVDENIFPLSSSEAESGNYTDPSQLDAALHGTFESGTWFVSGNWMVVNGSGEWNTPEITDNNGETFVLAEFLEDNNITRLNINNGITSLPDNFLYLGEGRSSNVEQVYLPQDLKKIGANAFRKSKINTLIPQSLKYIEEIYPTSNVFANAKCAVLPEHITEIGSYAFAGTKMLDEYTITMPLDLEIASEGLFYGSNVKIIYSTGANLKRIEKKAFTADKLKQLYLYYKLESIYEEADEIVTETYDDGEEETYTYNWGNGVGYKTNGERNRDLMVYSEAFQESSPLTVYCTNHNITKVVNSEPTEQGKITTQLDRGYFDWEYRDSSNIVTYKFEKNGDYIEKNDSYLNMEANYSVTASSREESICTQRDFFRYRANNSLPNVGTSTYSSYGIIPNGRYEVDKVTVENGLRMIKASNVFAPFNPKEIELPETLFILDYNVFGNCTRLESITLPDSLETIGEKVFYNCPNLQYVKFGKGMTTIPSKVMYNVKSLRFVDIGENTEIIDSQAFYNCTALEEIVIPDKVHTIKKEAFYNCINAQTITIGKGVHWVDNNAFSNSFYCENIIINSDKIVSDDLGSKFKNVGIYTNGVTVTFGDTVGTIDMRLIKNLKCKKLVIGKNVSTIKFLQYTPSTLEEIEIADGNTKFTLKNGMVFNGTYLHLAPRNIRTIKIPEDTTRIGTNAFNGSAITSISIPKNVTNIFDGAFANCKELKTVSLGKGVNVLDDGAFENDASLRLVYFPDNIMRVGERCFKNCKSLSNATFLFDTNNLGSFGKEAFYGCESLTSVVIPQNMREIADNVFQKCTSLNEIYIWNTAVQNNTFMKTNKSLTIHTMAGSPAHAVARTNNINFEAYTDEDAFLDECAIKIDEMAGYVGYCENGHGNIQYLTVYEADCENAGYIIGVCEFCSEILEEVSVPALGHHLTEEIHIPATNSTRGFTINKCHNCGESFCTYEEPLGDNITIETHTVKGKVTVAQSDKAQPTPYPISDVKIVIDDMVVATTDKNGNFELTLETGVYEAELRYTYGISRKIYIIIEDEDILITEPISMIACDFSKDNRIDEEDMTLFRMVISSKYDDVSYLRFVDLNNDGYINGRDQAYIRGCLGVSASEFSYPNVIISK